MNTETPKAKKEDTIKIRMEVPVYIKKALEKMALHYEYAKTNEDRALAWLERNGLMDDETINHLTHDCIGSNNPEYFIKYIEQKEC